MRSHHPFSKPGLLLTTGKVFVLVTKTGLKFYNDSFIVRQIYCDDLSDYFTRSAFLYEVYCEAFLDEV